MTHLDEGTLQAFLDDELRSRDRAAAAEHLMACAECRATHDELSRAKALFAEVVASLDTPPRLPAMRAPVAVPRRRIVAGGSVVRAAVLVLILAAAASAAVPGSPVREWITAAVREEPAPPATPAPVTGTAPAPAAPLPVGVALSPGVAGVDVELREVQAASIRLVTFGGPVVAVSATGGTTDPSFRTGADLIQVRGGDGGEILVQVPRTASDVRLLVDGEVYAEHTAGELTVRVPGRPIEGGVRWP